MGPFVPLSEDIQGSQSLWKEIFVSFLYLQVWIRAPSDKINLEKRQVPKIVRSNAMQERGIGPTHSTAVLHVLQNCFNICLPVSICSFPWLSSWDFSYSLWRIMNVRTCLNEGSMILVIGLTLVLGVPQAKEARVIPRTRITLYSFIYLRICPRAGVDLTNTNRPFQGSSSTTPASFTCNHSLEFDYSSWLMKGICTSTKNWSTSNFTASSQFLKNIF